MKSPVNYWNSWGTPLIYLAVLTSFVVAAKISKFAPSALFDQDGLTNARSILAGLARPNFEPEFLIRVLHLAVESVLVGFLGVFFALAIAVASSLITAKVPALVDAPGRLNPFYRVGATLLIRSIKLFLAVCRAVPDLVWAYAFVLVFGLGPGAAVFAIAFSNAGATGKIYGELIESIDPGPVRQLWSSGARRWSVLWIGAIPQVRNQWIDYALGRIECAIRSASILGIVGAGGLGSEIAINIRYFEFNKLATVLLALLALIVFLEWVSNWLRARSFMWTLGFMFVGSMAAIVTLEIPWHEIVAWNGAQNNLHFVTRSPSAVKEIPIFFSNMGLAAQTVMIAWFSTAIATIFCFATSPFAARTLTISAFQKDGFQSRGLSKIFAWFAFLSMRCIFQVLRAIPSITFAVAFVVWVGPGPFAGALAIACHTAGVLGQTFSEAYQDIKKEPVLALEAIGANPFARWIYGIFPQVKPRLLTHALFRFEVNVRESTVMGFVAAGGIGDAIHSSLSLFQLGKLAELLVAIFAIVAMTEMFSERVRAALLRAPAKIRKYRQISRLATEMTVRLRLSGADEFETARVLDFSVGGLLVQTDRLSVLKSAFILDLAFIGESAKQDINFYAQVAHVDEVNQTMGLKFLHLDPETQSLIEDLLKKRVENS